MPKVLIVEDDPTIRAAVTRALTDKGYAVATAHTAMSGLQLAVSERPDVVVLDLGLPDLDGREVLRMIRAVSAVPIIVATARSAESEIVRSLDAGADDYVVKPYRRRAARRPDPGGAAPRRRAGRRRRPGRRRTAGRPARPAGVRWTARPWT